MKEGLESYGRKDPEGILPPVSSFLPKRGAEGHIGLRKEGSLVSVRDIAAVCGVSPATVSKALNDRADISPATRERILHTAEELGYCLPAVKGQGRRPRYYNLGIITDRRLYSGAAAELPRGGGPTLLRVLADFRRRAAAAGCDVTWLSGAGAGRQGMNLEAYLRYRRLDGVCVILDGSGGTAGEGEWAMLRPARRERVTLPMVTIGGIVEGCPAVLPPQSIMETPSGNAGANAEWPQADAFIVRAPAERMGAMAAGLLIRRIEQYS